MKSKSASMVRRNHARYHRGRDDLNIVPMIDMMVILVFFLIFRGLLEDQHPAAQSARQFERRRRFAEGIEARDHHPPERSGGERP
jgi:hypothetical protein